MLDNTPVLNLKPYIPAADTFPEARYEYRGTETFSNKLKRALPLLLALRLRFGITAPNSD